MAHRDGNQITFRNEDEISEVTLVIRSDMKNDLKFLNKLQVYQCIDEGKIKAYFGTAIKEIRDADVVLMNARTSEEKITIPNDYIFAMIGGDRPANFWSQSGSRSPEPTSTSVKEKYTVGLPNPESRSSRGVGQVQ